MSRRPPPEPPMDWPRADPAALARFDARSKVCTMNCGPSSMDPRGERERQLLCEDCLPRSVEDQTPMKLIHMLVGKDYKPGDQAPEGYLQWHEWAEAQHKAGLRQKQCGRCGLWRFPQQLSDVVDRYELTVPRRRSCPRVTAEAPVCNACAAKAPPASAP